MTASSSENSVRKKIARRILPFIFILYIIAALDRANVAYAKITMMADQGFSEAVFGFGAGIFFVGYLLLEIPGALIVERWSARRWISRILITWGICAALVGFVTTSKQFYMARFGLGLAEGGFFPGILVYLTHWFCARDRARAVAGLVLAIPVSLALGAPISAAILRLGWLGASGWRWMFILEGFPAILLGVVTLFYLTDRPEQAGWLEPEERDWIASEIESELRTRRSSRQSLIWILRDRNVILLALALFFANLGTYAFIFWLPSTIHKASGRSAMFSVAASSLPFALSIISVLWSGRSSDERGERKWHTVIPLLCAGFFFPLSAMPGTPFLIVMAWLCATGSVLFAWAPSFWALPSLTLNESAAAASVGLINSVGNLGGFIGPSIVGYLLSRNVSQTLTTGMLGGCFAVGAVLVLFVRVSYGQEVPLATTTVVSVRR